MQRCAFIFRAGVAGDQVQVGNRHVELGFFRVGQHQKLGLLIFYGQVGQAQITPHAVIYVYYGCPLTQFGEIANDGVAHIRRFAATPALHHALAK